MMRRVQRPVLSGKTLRLMAEKQDELNLLRCQGKTADISDLWKDAQKEGSLIEVRETLAKMLGPRLRCVYCVDSEATDIEHFRPKSKFPEYIFQWHNLLFSCKTCNLSHKGSRFPFERFEPLLIDPATEEPWDYFDFEPRLGKIVAIEEAGFNKAQETIKIFKLDRESLKIGYKKTYRRLSKVVEDYLCTPHDRLIDALLEADDHGLLGWCFKGLGQHEAPFSDLKARHPAVWQDCLAAFEYC